MVLSMCQALFLAPYVCKPSRVGTIIIPILNMRRLRPGQVNSLL